MSVEDLEQYEAELELSLYREYRDVVGMFRYVVETDRRFYLANGVEITERGDERRPWLEIELTDAWVWDMYRPVRFTPHVQVVTYRDVNIEDRNRSSGATVDLSHVGDLVSDDERGRHERDVRHEPRGGERSGSDDGPRGGPADGPRGGPADGERGPRPDGGPQIT